MCKSMLQAFAEVQRLTILSPFCRIYNARQHQTFEDTTYHLQNTILTGDVSEPDSVRVHVEVLNGSIAIQPLVDLYLAQGLLA